jgi:hypothetical protein
LIFSIILAGVSIVVAQIIFNILPIGIFPCKVTDFTRETIDTVCRLRDISSPPEYVIAVLTPGGELLKIAVTIIIPVITGFLIVRLTKPSPK